MFIYYNIGIKQEGDRMQELIEEVRKELEETDGFNLESIFPFYKHSTRVDISQLELLDQVCGTQYAQTVIRDGWVVDANTGFYS